jgi:hypothetical protein
MGHSVVALILTGITQCVVPSLKLFAREEGVDPEFALDYGTDPVELRLTEFEQL